MRTINKALTTALLGAETVALCAHIAPDGDTVGSVLALKMGLEQLGKQVRVFCQDKIPDNLMMLSGADCFENETAVRPQDHFDVFATVDVSTAERMGRCRVLLEHADQALIVDHHGTNPCSWAEICELDGASPACALLVYALLRDLGAEITVPMAECLYTAISTDTGNFSYKSTSAEAFTVQAELMATGFDMSELNRRLFRERALPHVLLVRNALQSLQMYEDGRIAALRITMQDMEECHALPEHTDTIVNQGLEIEGVQMALFARESPSGAIKMSLRGIPGHPVDQIAASFGGGGHDLAAGITFPEGTLDGCMNQVIDAMRQTIERGN